MNYQNMVYMQLVLSHLKETDKKTKGNKKKDKEAKQKQNKNAEPQKNPKGKYE